MSIAPMTEQQRAEYIRLSFATVNTLVALEAANAAPPMGAELRDRISGMYRAHRTAVVK